MVLNKFIIRRKNNGDDHQDDSDDDPSVSKSNEPCQERNIKLLSSYY